MAIESQIENAQKPVETPSLADESAALQLGGREFASLRSQAALPKEFPSENEFQIDDNGAQDDGTSGNDKGKAVPEIPTIGSPEELTPENREKVDQLFDAAKAAESPDSNTASTLKALTDQAQRFGSNPDGSPKVKILAFQSPTTDGNPIATTSFLASFANNARLHEINNSWIGQSRTSGTNYLEPGSVGFIGEFKGRRAGPVI